MLVLFGRLVKCCPELAFQISQKYFQLLLTAQVPASWTSFVEPVKKFGLGFEDGKVISNEVEPWRHVFIIERTKDCIPSTSNAPGR
jgi:hypothetical protein